MASGLYLPESYIPQQEFLERPLKTAVAVDPENPHEIDDAFEIACISRKKGDYTVSVHIADAGLLYDHPELIDAAREKGWTRYEEENSGVLDPLFPDDITKKYLGLDAGGELGAPSVEVSFEFNAISRAIGNVSIQKSRVECDLLSYDEFDTRLKEDKALSRRTLAVTKNINSGNSAHNAPSLARSATAIVGSLMVAVNRIMTNVREKDNLPWLSRNQGSGAFLNWRDDRERKVFEQMRLARYAIQPTGHDSLGFKYCHFSSPLRRFPDTANHLNQHAKMTGRPIYFDHQDMEDIAEEHMRLRLEAGTNIKRKLNMVA